MDDVAARGVLMFCNTRQCSIFPASSPLHLSLLYMKETALVYRLPKELADIQVRHSCHTLIDTQHGVYKSPKSGKKERHTGLERDVGDHVGFDRTVFSSILRLWDWATLVENTRSQGTSITMRSYLEQCDRPQGCLAATPPPSNPSPGISPRP
ncbi:hypothetical protein R3I94_009077 [Phoxinus phoxinus]